MGKGVLPEGGFRSDYDGGFAEGVFDKKRLESVSEETRAQIMQRYNYAINHVLVLPLNQGYVDGFNSVDD